MQTYVEQSKAVSRWVDVNIDLLTKRYGEKESAGIGIMGELVLRTGSDVQSHFMAQSVIEVSWLAVILVEVYGK